MIRLIEAVSTEVNESLRMVLDLGNRGVKLVFNLRESVDDPGTVEVAQEDLRVAIGDAKVDKNRNRVTLTMSTIGVEDELTSSQKEALFHRLRRHLKAYSVDSNLKDGSDEIANVTIQALLSEDVIEDYKKELVVIADSFIGELVRKDELGRKDEELADADNENEGELVTESIEVLGNLSTIRLTHEANVRRGGTVLEFKFNAPIAIPVSARSRAYAVLHESGDPYRVIEDRDDRLVISYGKVLRPRALREAISKVEMAVMTDQPTLDWLEEYASLGHYTVASYRNESLVQKVKDGRYRLSVPVAASPSNPSSLDKLLRSGVLQDRLDIQYAYCNRPSLVEVITTTIPTDEDVHYATEEIRKAMVIKR